MDQAISGNPYYDTLSIAVVNPTTTKKAAKKSGKVTAESAMVVSSDGKIYEDVGFLARHRCSSLQSCGGHDFQN